jgi:hypothetical protein
VTVKQRQCVLCGCLGWRATRTRSTPRFARVGQPHTKTTCSLQRAELFVAPNGAFNLVVRGQRASLTNARYVRPGSTQLPLFFGAPSTPHHPCHPRIAGRSPARSSSKVPRKASKSPARGENQRAAQAITYCIATHTTNAPLHAPKPFLDAILASCSMQPLTRIRTRDARTNAHTFLQQRLDPRAPGE